MGCSATTTPPASRGRQELGHLTELTGGAAYFPPSVDEIYSVVLSLAHQIRKQYTIAYTPLNQSLDGSYRTIRVKVTGPAVRRSTPVPAIGQRRIRAKAAAGGAEVARKSGVRGRELIALLLSTLWVGSSSAISQDTSSRARDRIAYSVVHDDALRRAQVWLEPAIPIEKARLGQNPDGPDTFRVDEVVSCRFRPGGVSGSTPKFDCELATGKKVKVKYGRDNAEVYAEVAASRLLAALGFPTDRVYVVDRVRCYGCPPDPYVGLECINEGKSIERCFPDLDYRRYVDFESAVIERPLEGRRIETAKERGWKWEELVKIDAVAGGAPRAHVDALRLMAMFLNHWDNKDKNQRLLCLGEKDPPGRLLDPRPCGRPLAMVQDLGGTFGPFKLDLSNWASTRVWADAPRCAVSMRALPYEGSTFPDWQISEEGRRFLAGRLGRLSAQQIRKLFEGARVQRYPHKDPAAADVGNWVRAFQDKVRAITERAPCPT